MKLSKGIIVLRIFFLLLFAVGVFISGILFQKHVLTLRISPLISIAQNPFQSQQRNIQKSGHRIKLRTRKLTRSEDAKKIDSEKDSTYRFFNENINISRAALVLIDVWSRHNNDGWLQRARKHQQSKLAPLLEVARKHNLTIIHAPHEQEIAEISSPLPNELVLDFFNSTNDTIELHNYLRANQIDTLFFAGYSSNLCLIARPAGIIKMHTLGYNIIVLRDCTIAFETPDTLEKELTNKVTIDLIESHWGRTTTLDDLRFALENKE